MCSKHCPIQPYQYMYIYTTVPDGWVPVSILPTKVRPLNVSSLLMPRLTMGDWTWGEPFSGVGVTRGVTTKKKT